MKNANAPAANTVLIAGASGVIGAAAVERFARLPDFSVIALSRRKPVVPPDCTFTHCAVDLSDAGACRQAIAALQPVSHLVYAAVKEAPGLSGGWHDRELMAANEQMFANLLHPLTECGHLRHVSLLQGAKAYGAHVHPVTIPLREVSPRDPHANFYWLQEDLLREASAKAGFAFTIWRPQVLLGSAPGAAMNPVAAIGAYAAICKERNLPFALPGTSEALLELVDADLLGKAFFWATRAREATNETFNITNGDTFVLRHAWPSLAKAMGLSSHGPAPTDLSSFFAEPQNRQAWKAIVSRCLLAELSLEQLLGQSHHYLDLLNGTRLGSKATPVLLSTIKLRQAGFQDCRDSSASLIAQIRKMTELRLLPPLLA